MKARLVKFGEIEVEKKRYTHDVVIDGGKVRKRKKGPSKQFREKFGHTPLSAGEEMLWGDKRLIVLSFIQDKKSADEPEVDIGDGSFESLRRAWVERLHRDPTPKEEASCANW